MNSPIHLLYSADYELYLGENFLPEEEVLVQPTARLLEVAAGEGIPFTLFADVLCFQRYRELGRGAFPAAAEAQLRRAVAAGQDVQLHLHPHWPVATPGAGGWAFPPAAYALGNLGSDETGVARAVERLAREGRAYLEELLQPVRPDYRCLAFRAGGYALQPRERGVLAGLAAAGLRIDSSFVPGMCHSSPNGGVAFDPRLLEAHPNPRLGGELGLAAPDPHGQGVREVPIAAIPRPSRWHQRPRVAAMAARQAWGVVRGRGEAPRGRPCFVPPRDPPAEAAGPLRRAWWRWWGAWHQPWWRLELGRDPGMLVTVLEEYVATHQRSGTPLFLSLNCHPKGLGPDHLRALVAFHHRALSRFGIALQPLTFQQAARVEL